MSELSDDLENSFTEVADTVTEEEQENLNKKLEDRDSGKDKYGYGHDLHAAIQRGYNRKQRAAVEDFAKWTGKSISSVAEVSIDRLFWHMLCELVRWAHKNGMTKEDIVIRLERHVIVTKESRRL